MKADLHIHSTFSDGTDDVEQIALMARDAGLQVVALTDHDTFAGTRRFISAIRDVGLNAITSLEMSSRTLGHDVHVLGYGPNPDAPELARELAKIRGGRLRRAQETVNRLSERYAVSWEDVVDIAGDAVSVGRPHIADALVGIGMMPDRATAFQSVLADGSEFVAKAYLPPTEEAIRLIRVAGGLPVVAHPMARESRELIATGRIALWRACGLWGLEVFHRENLPEDVPILLDLAREHALAVTGGSDFHGSGKPNTLGERGPSEDALAELLCHAAQAA